MIQIMNFKIIKLQIIRFVSRNNAQMCARRAGYSTMYKTTSKQKFAAPSNSPNNAESKDFHILILIINYN